MTHTAQRAGAKLQKWPTLHSPILEEKVDKLHMLEQESCRGQTCMTGELTTKSLL